MKRSEIQVPFSFMVMSIVWIIFSDKFFLHRQTNISSFQITHIQTIKGCFFVCAVTVFLHLMIKSSNKQLRQSQAEYKDLFYNTPTPMLLYNLETKKFTNVNKAALEKYGYTTEELAQMSIDQLRLTTDKIDGKCNIHKHQKKNKEVIICQETTREIALKNAQSILLSAYEITELENAKAELIRREKQLRLILNSITDGFFILGYDLTIQKANELFKSMVEVSVEKVEGHKLFNLFPSMKEKFLYKQYSLELQKSRTLHFETYYERTKAWYRISAYPFEKGGFCVFFRDITRQKEDELRIYQNEQNLSALINNTQDLIWSIDCDFRYFTFNEPFRKWYKHYFSEEVWIGKVAFCNDKENAFDTKWKSLYERALKGEKFSVDMDFEIDNKCRHTRLRFNPIYNASGKIFGVGCFLQNITESKLHQRKIEQQNAQLKEIAFITSHKVRVPLANILGLTEILDIEDPVSSSNVKIIEYIKTSAKELDKSIINMVQQTMKANN
ncbi:PAS domain-containing protein [Segetibacter koreensis]|uniref:PAS domain-containing protein n=1 Tax=Segetibacter koreensis TaxID=398037 RepID=UPI001B7FEF7E|nr:PAS domain-containing protein [Segetibacter koreensis]